MEVGADNWDLAPGASDPEADHARHILPVGLAAEHRSVVRHHAEAASPRKYGDEGTRCARERMLAPGKILG